VFVIGDLALVEGAETLPQVAQPAIQQGRSVADNLVRELAGLGPRPFRYHDPGTMATIGRNRAVAVVLGVQLAGRLAWWMWLVAHLVFLAGFRNRLVVFVNWVYHYVSYDLGLRSIIGTRRPRRAQNGAAAARDADAA
jgi:NADH dehydrogenase